MHIVRPNRAVPLDQQEPPPPTDYELGELTAADEEAQAAGRLYAAGYTRAACIRYEIAADLYASEGRHEAAHEMREAAEALVGRSLREC